MRGYAIRFFKDRRGLRWACLPAFEEIAAIHASTRDACRSILYFAVIGALLARMSAGRPGDYPSQHEGAIVVLPQQLNLRVRAYAAVVGPPRPKTAHAVS